MKRIATCIALSLVLAVPAAMAADDQNGMGGQPETSGSMSPSAAPQSGSMMGESAAKQTAQAGSLYSLTAKQVAKRDLVDAKGNRLGRVGEVVVANSGDDAYALIKVGGFYGIGGKWAAIPFRDLALKERELWLNQAVAKTELPSRYPYHSDRYKSVQSGQVVAVALGMNASDIAQFEALDKNHDGTVSKEEARSDAGLENAWSSADKNDDGKLDRSEFSAFESNRATMGEPAGGGAMMQENGSSPQQNGNGGAMGK